MRVGLISAILLVIGFAYYLFQSAPTRGLSRGDISSKRAAQLVDTPARRISESRVTEAEESGTAGKKKSNADRAEAPEKEVEKGPFEINLGTHTLHSRADRGQAIRTTVLLTVPDAKTRKDVFLQRRRLTRMLYFLGAKRRADGARGSEGKDRFMRDLAVRFKNVIRSGSIDGIELRDYEVITVDLPDLGTQNTK